MSSPRSRPAAGSTPTRNDVGRPISAQRVMQSLRISSVVGGSGCVSEEEGAAATGGEPVARDFEDTSDETRGVIGVAGVPEDLQRRDAEGLIGADKRVLQHRDLSRFDAFWPADADLAH